MANAIKCDCCGRTLKLPANQTTAAGWTRQDLTWNQRHYTAHTCPNCPESYATAKLEALKR